MGSNMASRSAAPSESITGGTGNVFAHLGFPGAPEVTPSCACLCAQPSARRARTPAGEAATALRSTQPLVPVLRNYKLPRFSVERLMNLVTALDQDVDRDAKDRDPARLTELAPVTSCGRSRWKSPNCKCAPVMGRSWKHGVANWARPERAPMAADAPNNWK
jgi:hypothetical protein